MAIYTAIGILLQSLCIVMVGVGAAAMLLAPRPAFLPAQGRASRRMLWQAALWALASRLIILLLMVALAALFGQATHPLDLLVRWDAPHYLHIAEHGYTADRSLGDGYLFIVFFPLYPAVVGLLGRLLGGAYAVVSIAISTACLAGACVTLYNLALMDGDAAYARRVLVLLVVYPASFFLGMPYTESLFLLLSALCLYWLRKERWYAAGAAGLLAALTRNVGAVLALPMAIELLQRYADMPGDPGAEPQRPLGVLRALTQRRFWRGFMRRGWACALPPVGTLIYLGINYLVYGDALQFLVFQREHWSQTMQPFYRSISVTWQGVVHADAMTALFLWGPQLLMMLASLALLPALLRRMRLSYGAYLLAFMLVSLSPSWLLSYTRYMLGAVPLFLGLAQWARRRGVLLAVVLGCAALGLLMLTGYVLGYCVV